MTNAEFGFVILALALFLGGVHGLGYLFERLRQPRLVGEILAGILLGPWVLKLIAPSIFHQLFNSFGTTQTILGFVYNLGLILLMFCSGSETRRLMAKENQRQIFTLIGVADVANFALVLSLGFAGLLPLATLTGSTGQESAALLVLAIAVAVTSIPVISRIFWDLKIMRTRFVSLILGSAVIEDIALWAVLAVATAITKAGGAASTVTGSVAGHIFSTAIYMVIAMFLAPQILKFLTKTRWNLLYKSSHVGWLAFILFVYCAIATIFDVSLVFAAFLAGFGIVGGINGTERERFREPLEAVAKVSFGIFIPIYFGMVGYKLVFGGGFSLALLVVFFLGSTLLSLATSGFAARLAGFKGLDIFNIALTTNARGGPGIVLASVAYDSGIINAAFYTTLVLTAVFTSQLAGAWLRYVLGKGWPLLSTNPDNN